jgi:TAP-like protein
MTQAVKGGAKAVLHFSGPKSPEGTMKKWLNRIGIGLLVIVFLFSVATYLRFSQWRSESTKNLARDSTVVHTAKGPIEYAQIGQGPPVLMIQGTADVNVPIAHGEFAHAQIAGSQFVQLRGEDHWMVITKHKELGKLIHAFLVEHAGAE